MLDVHSEKLRSIVEEDGKSALVLFYGNWCGDCGAFKPTWDLWNKSKIGPIYAVEVLRGGKEWKEWGIDEIPTVAIYSDGIEKGRVCGIISEPDLNRLWNKIRRA